MPTAQPEIITVNILPTQENAPTITDILEQLLLQEIQQEIRQERQIDHD